MKCKIFQKKHITIVTVVSGYRQTKGGMELADLALDCIYNVPLWRKIQWEERDKLVDEVKHFSTRLKSVPKVNILMLGMVGSGKTSFNNSIDSAFKGRISHSEESLLTSSGAASISKKLRILNLAVRDGGPVGFPLCDTMGMEDEDGFGLNLGDLPYILDGHVPHDYALKANEPITRQSDGFIESPKMDQKIHCIVYVVDGTKVNVMPSAIRAKFQQLNKHASERNIRVVVLVTHIDKMCETVNKSVREAYRSEAVKDTVDKISEITGVSLSLIYLAKNYYWENKLNPDVDVLNVSALQKMLNCAQDCLDNYVET